MPVKDKVATEQFTRRVSIQQFVESADDGQGGTPGSWVTVYSCWADLVDFPNGRYLIRKLFAQQLYPQTSRLVHIRYQQQLTITPAMRVQYAHGATIHNYKILGVEDINEAHVSLMLYCQEDQAKGAP